MGVFYCRSRQQIGIVLPSNIRARALSRFGALPPRDAHLPKLLYAPKVAKSSEGAQARNVGIFEVFGHLRWEMYLLCMDEPSTRRHGEYTRASAHHFFGTVKRASASGGSG